MCTKQHSAVASSVTQVFEKKLQNTDRSPTPEIVSQRSIHSIHSLLLSGLFLLDNLWKISTKWQLWYGVRIPSRWKTWILLPTQDKKGSQHIKVKWKNQPKCLCHVNPEMQFQQKSGQTEFGCLFFLLKLYSEILHGSRYKPLTKS